MEDRLIEEAITIVRSQTFHFVKSMRLPSRVAFDDLFQEALLRMVKHITKFDPTKARLTTFLSKHTFGAIVDYLRHAEGYSRENGITTVVSMTPEHGSDLVSEFLVNKPDPKIDIETGYINAISTPEFLRNAIEFLSHRSRTVIVLYYFEGKSLAKISSLLGVGESRVYQLRAIALKELEVVLSEMGVTDASQLIDL